MPQERENSQKKYLHQTFSDVTIPTDEGSACPTSEPELMV
jgi:hypothetical protein